MTTDPKAIAAKVADRMILHMPSALGSDDCGSITIGPHKGDDQAWQLWVRFSDDEQAARAARQIRKWIRDAITEAINEAIQ